MHLHRRLLYVAVLALAVGATAAQANSTRAPRYTVIKNVGAFPLDMSLGYGSVWVNDHRGGTLYRISRRNKVRKLVIGESLCNFPAIGGGRVWVWGCDSNKTYEIDPERMKVVGHRQGIGPVYGAGSLWTVDASGNVLRIDPKSGVVLATVRVDTTNGGPDIVAGGSLWVSSDTSVSRIDVNTNKVSAVIPLPNAQPSGDKSNGYLYANFGTLAYGTFWDSNAAGLYAINPTTNAAKRLGVKIRPLAQAGDVPVVAGAGSVWVRTSNKTVARIDPKTARLIRTYPASSAGGGGGIAVAFRSLWVANAGLGNVWRIRLR